MRVLLKRTRRELSTLRAALRDALARCDFLERRRDHWRAFAIDLEGRDVDGTGDVARLEKERDHHMRVADEFKARACELEKERDNLVTKAATFAFSRDEALARAERHRNERDEAVSNWKAEVSTHERRADEAVARIRALETERDAAKERVVHLEIERDSLHEGVCLRCRGLIAAARDLRAGVA